MKIVTLSIIFIFSIFLIDFTTCDAIRAKNLPRFISFDHKGGQIDIDLDLSIPFISIPLHHESNKSGDHPKPLVNINVKALTFAAIFAGMTAFIVPLFVKPHSHHQNYRLDDEFGLQQAGQTINELILGNNYITPCVQQAICSAVMKTKKNNIPTSTEKIIDGISNLSWFRHATNGTAIEEAINAAHQPDVHCDRIFNECGLPGDVFQAIMNELGIK